MKLCINIFLILITFTKFSFAQNVINHSFIDKLKTNALVFAVNKEYGKAIIEYKKILNFNYDDFETMLRIAECYSYLNDVKQSAFYLRLALEMGYKDYMSVRSSEALKNSWSKDEFVKLKNDFSIYNIAAKDSLIFYKTSTYTECLLKLPKRFRERKEYDLIIGLHGYGGDMHDMSIIWGENSKDFIYAVPEATYQYKHRNKKSATQYSWFLRDYEYMWEKADPAVIENIGGLIKQLKSQFNISRVYILGFSQGAALAYLSGIVNHEDVNGVIAFGGYLPSKFLTVMYDEEMPENIKKLDYFIAHGDKDKSISEESAYKAKEFLESKGASVKLNIFNGGHQIPKQSLQKVLDWLYPDEKN